MQLKSDSAIPTLTASAVTPVPSVVFCGAVPDTERGVVLVLFPELPQAPSTTARTTTRTPSRRTRMSIPPLPPPWPDCKPSQPTTERDHRIAPTARRLDTHPPR